MPDSVADLGEFGLIDAVTARLPQGGGVELGPGDDAAVIAAPDGRVVVTTDMLLEGRHFRRDWSSPHDVGRKAAAQNLADVAAMGARPTAITVGLGAPGDLESAWALELADGLRTECDLVGASVVGGDTVGAVAIIVAVTAFGDLGGRAPVRRSGARVGDVVAVCGRLGWAAAGLAVLSGYDADEGRGSGGARPLALSGDDADEGRGSGGARPLALSGDDADEGRGSGDDASTAVSAVVDAHRHPEVPYDAGPEAAELGATAMCDVSDGLLADVGHIADASGVRVDLEVGALEVDEPVRRTAELLGVDPVRWVLTGGDDNALVATFPEGVPLPGRWRVVGRVSTGSGVAVNGGPYEGRAGHDHFG